MSTERTIQLLALGPPEVRVDDEPITVSPKRLAVLAYLALASGDGVVRRDSLVSIFWPEADDTRARNALNQVLHHLRRHLGSGAIRSRGHEELVVGHELGTDVARFEAHLEHGEHEAALEVYRGDLLEGLHLTAAAAFERWLDGVRARFRRRARDTALRLARTEEGAGRSSRAIANLRRALEVDPVAEEAARDLIRLLLDDGRRVAAQREYRRIVWRLRIWTGLQPSDELRRLVEAAGLDADDPGGGPDVVRLPSLVRRSVGELTDRAAELLEGGAGENMAARELLRQAVRLDPTYAPAHALASWAIADWVMLFGGSFEALASGLQSADRALGLAPKLPEAHLARGYLLERAGRLDEAIGSYRDALQLQPGHRVAATRLVRVIFWKGDFERTVSCVRELRRHGGDASSMTLERAMVRHCLGQHDLGDDLYRRILDVDPGNRLARSSRVYFSFVSGHRDRAVRQARAAVDREPRSFIGIISLADAVLVAEDFDEAIHLYEQCHSVNPESRNWGTLRSTRTALGFVHLRAGDAARGRRLLDAAERETLKALRAGSTFGGLHYDLASVHAARGETDQALQWLERSRQAGWLQHEFLDLDPIFASLRGDERFEGVRKSMEREVADQRART